MLLRKWEKLPEELRIDEVRPYYDILQKKRLTLIFKRCFDVIVSFILLILLCPVFFALALAIKIDSRGPVFFKQDRVTTYGKIFKIHKFRTMVDDAEKIGPLVTAEDDERITRVGRFIRKVKLDEICQLIDVLSGNMTLVGARPETTGYVNQYTNEMKATLLLPAGITSRASILFLDEQEMLSGVKDVDKEYLEKILPEKMKYNLEAIKTMSFFGDIKIMFMTAAILGKDYSSKKEN